MYVYLCIPAVAKYQWHPISLASSPSADNLAVLVGASGGDSCSISLQLLPGNKPRALHICRQTLGWLASVLRGVLLTAHD